jgi:cellulase/cellobiase CelA1
MAHRRALLGLLLGLSLAAVAPLAPGSAAGAGAATTTVTTTGTTSCVPENGGVLEIGPTFLRFRIPSRVCVPQAIFFVDVLQPAPDGSWTVVASGSAQRDASGGGSVPVTGLTPATTYWYAFRDPRGVSAPRTGPVTTLALTSTSTTSTPACTATYFRREEWAGAFRGEVRVTAGPAGLAGWSVSWTLGAGQGVTQSWNADVTTSGTSVTARNVPWNGTLAPGATATFGFLGRWAGTDPVPEVSCSTG